MVDPDAPPQLEGEFYLHMVKSNIPVSQYYFELGIYFICNSVPKTCTHLDTHSTQTIVNWNIYFDQTINSTLKFFRFRINYKGS